MGGSHARHVHKAGKSVWVAIALFASVCQADEIIEDVIVVAQKREQSIQEAPVPVSVVSGARIEHAGIYDLFDLAPEVPALSVVQNTGPINTSFRLRRIGNEANIPNFEPAVGLFVDGAFRARSGVAVGDLVDLERIEVVRGPQTVLYGKNTTAGVVSILTRAPADVFELAGSMSMGRIEGFDAADLVRVDGVIGGPLTDKLSARLSGGFLDHGHTMKNLFVADDSQDMDRHSLRGQLAYSPTERFDARLIIGRFAIDSTNTAEFEIDEGVALAATNAAFGVPCPLKSSTDRAFCNNHAVVTDLEANDTTLILDFDLRRHSLTSITAYEDYATTRDFDADQLNIDVANLIDRRASESYSQELRLQSAAGGAIEWLGGLFLYRNEFQRGDPTRPSVILGSDAASLDLPQGIPFGEPGDAGILTSRTESEHVSVFGNATWRPSDRLSLSAGARWQREDKTSVIVNTANHSRPTLITLVLAPPGASAELARDTAGVSFNLTAQYRWSADLIGYASAASGFKSGGFNAGFSPTPGASREFGDETVRNVELGIKTMLAADRVRLNASLFHAEYDDYQSAGFVSLRFRVNNAERVDVSGFELELEALAGERLRVATSISYADARYGRYTAGACHYGRPPDNAAETGCVLTGYPLPLAPEWKTWLNLEYERPGAFGSLYAGLDWSWVDRHFTNATLDPRHVQAPYSLVNVRAGLRRGRFDVSVWIRNLGDETIILQDGPTNLFARDPAFARFLDMPRSYGLTLRADW